MRNRQGITIAALIIAIIGLSIGFAAFSNTLTIRSSASVNPTNTMNVVFSSSHTDAETDPIVPELDPSNVTGFTSTNGTIVESGRTLSNLSASFTAPGQSVTYNLYVYNDGPYVAYLRDLTMGSISCEAIENQEHPEQEATESLVTAACRGMSVSVTIGETTLTASGSLNNQSLSANGGYVSASVTISYASGSAYVDGPMSVTIGDITFTASSVAGEVVTPENPSEDDDLICFYVESETDENTGDTYGVITGYNAECGTSVTIPNEAYVTEVVYGDWDDDACASTIGDECSGIKSAYLAGQLSDQELLELSSMGIISTQYSITNTQLTIKKIADVAFSDLNLESVTFEANSSITDIGIGAFSSNSLNQIEIPSSVTSISRNAFQDNPLTGNPAVTINTACDTYKTAFTGNGQFGTFDINNIVWGTECTN